VKLGMQIRTISISLENTEQQFTVESLTEYFINFENIEIIIPFMYIGQANSNLDVAEDYLFSLFFGENIYPLCKSVYCQETSRSFSFNLCVNSACELASAAIQFSYAYNNEWNIDFENSIMEFKFSLKKQKLFFPELADRYMANLISGKDDLCLDQAQSQSHYDRTYALTGN